jgi:RNA polymerase sigma factor (sigma-70 family)
MTHPRAGDLLGQLRKLLGGRPACRQTDADLVARFAADRDEGAFVALVHRHGPRVWRVCRAMLGQEQDAEDAFQATFLVLARQAGSVHKASSVASWLHGVAVRVAAQARTRAALPRIPLVEPIAARQGLPDDLDRDEVHAVLHEELARLAEADRAPLVLCYLEGKTQDEAAGELGWSKSTLRRRLERGRSRLARRLSRRGLALSAPVLAGLAAGEAGAVPPALLRANLSDEAVPERVRNLIPEASKLMGPIKVKMAAAVLAVGVLVAGAGLAAYCALAGTPPVPPEQPARKRDAEPNDKDRAGKANPVHVLKNARTFLFSPDGKRMAFIDYDLQRWITRDGRNGCAHTLHVRETATGKELWTFDEAGPFGVAAFSPDGKTLAATATDMVRLWNSATGKPRITLTVPGEKGLGPPNISALAFSPDGKSLAAESMQVPLVHSDLDPTTIRMILTRWEVATGKQLVQRLGARGAVFQLAGFSPDGKLLTWDGGRLTDVRTGAALCIVGPMAAFVPHPFLAPDTKTCYWPSPDYGDFSLRGHDVTRNRELPALKGHNGSVVAVAFSPDGKSVATGSSDGTVRLWERATGKALHVLRGHDRPSRVGGLAFAPDGKTLASGGDDGKVILWDPAAGKVRDELRGHRGRIEAVSFSPDGKLLAASASWANDKSQAEQAAFLWEVAGRR